FEQRGIMPVIDHPKAGKFKMVAWPVRHSGSPPPVAPAPLLGAHTADVLSHWLDLPEGEIGTLRQTGVVG
ncbi:MAG: CoA transferase, partial [Rhodospirillales bacterium]|nr:CoA transferase [Rhodospirillales bacterium]